MSFQNDPYLDLVRGARRKYSVIHKFGHISQVRQDYTPVTRGGIYPTPQIADATTLRVKSGGNANDTAGGTGARKILLEGVGIDGAVLSEELITAGTSASSSTTGVFLRLFKISVSESGTYSTAVFGSHAAAITIEDTAGSEDWGSISAAEIPASVSAIAVHTVPKGYTAFVTQMDITTDSKKIADVLFFKRGNILETTAPYTAMEIVVSFKGITNTSHTDFRTPLGPFPPYTDIGFMAKTASGKADVDIDFEIVLIATA